MATASANYKDEKRRATRVLRQQAERTHGDDVDGGASDSFGATAYTNRQTTRTKAHLELQRDTDVNCQTK